MQNKIEFKKNFVYLECNKYIGPNKHEQPKLFAVSRLRKTCTNISFKGFKGKYAAKSTYQVKPNLKENNCPTIPFLYEK